MDDAIRKAARQGRAEVTIRISDWPILLGTKDESAIRSVVGQIKNEAMGSEHRFAVEFQISLPDDAVERYAKRYPYEEFEKMTDWLRSKGYSNETRFGKMKAKEYHTSTVEGAHLVAWVKPTKPSVFVTFYWGDKSDEIST